MSTGLDTSAALALCKHFEGFSAKPYLCPANVWTIGYGSTYYENNRKVTPSDAPVTKERAEELLRYEIAHTYLPGVLRYCPSLAAFPGPLNAAVDFVYNLGVGRLQTSTLRRRLNEHDWDEAKNELKKWVRGGGRILPGLVKRRDAECALIG